MRRTVRWTLTLTLTLLLLSLPLPLQAAPSSQVTSLAESNQAFSGKLYKALASDTEGNLFFSPFSITAALGMTYAGAKGMTAQEMAKTLAFTLPAAEVHEGLSGLMAEVSGARCSPRRSTTCCARPE